MSCMLHLTTGKVYIQDDPPRCATIPLSMGKGADDSHITMRHALHNTIATSETSSGLGGS